MNYRSISDMNDAILRNLHRIPPDIDLIVGVPRSGMFAAELLALLINVQLTDLDSYSEGRVFTSGITKRIGKKTKEAAQQKVLVIDDSINGGTAMQNARDRIAEAAIEDIVLFAAVYGSKPNHPEADLVMETVAQPRMFQWNFMHHKFLRQSCIDIDGVLCHDPSKEENDDGPIYARFLEQARPLYRFTRPLGTLVTSRLEKYREPTEAWLKSQGVRYETLRMLDLPSKKERQRLGIHGAFKAEVYRESDASLFIESENAQAFKIAEISGKPTLCLQTHKLILPSRGTVVDGVFHLENSTLRRLAKTAAYSLVGKEKVAAIKRKFED